MENEQQGEQHGGTSPQKTKSKSTENTGAHKYSPNIVQGVSLGADSKEVYTVLQVDQEVGSTGVKGKTVQGADHAEGSGGNTGEVNLETGRVEGSGGDSGEVDPWRELLSLKQPVLGNTGE